MVSCAACGCSQTTTNKNLEITFHQFPKFEYKRIAWVNFVKKPEWVVRTTSVLCSQHFTEECFDRTSQLKVRLQPTAIPTIEVDRLKYVRTFNKVQKRPAEDVTKNNPSKIQKFEPSRSTRTPSPTLLSVKQYPEDSPQKKKLKETISELQKNNILQSKRIRNLQKVVWRQKKQISSLKSLTIQLKKTNLILQEHETILPD